MATEKQAPTALELHAAIRARLRDAGVSVENLPETEVLAAFRDPVPVQQAQARHSEMLERKASAEAAHAEAEAAHRVAKERARLAINGHSADCPVECSKAEEDASKMLDLRAKVLAGAEQNVAAAARDVERAEAVALQPAAIEVWGRRLRSIAKADRAREMLSQATAEYQAACRMNSSLVSRGVPYPLQNAGDNAGGAPWTMADELARWDGTPHRVSWWDNDVRALLREAGN
jgi:hypothetical protein